MQAAASRLARSQEITNMLRLFTLNLVHCVSLWLDNSLTLPMNCIWLINLYFYVVLVGLKVGVGLNVTLYSGSLNNSNGTVYWYKGQGDVERESETSKHIHTHTFTHMIILVLWNTGLLESSMFTDPEIVCTSTWTDPPCGTGWTIVPDRRVKWPN